MSWRIRGTYFESCNCDAICPCRRIDGRAGGRSTHGVCLGVLSWLIHEGAAEGTDLSGLPVALASRYSDDEPGSPWTWTLYLDARASAEQRTALEGIFTGRLGGDALRHFPWAWKASELVAVTDVFEPRAVPAHTVVVEVQRAVRHQLLAGLLLAGDRAGCPGFGRGAHLQLRVHVLRRLRRARAPRRLSQLRQRLRAAADPAGDR